MEITRSTVEVYKIRTANTWADITIDANGNTGRISISSDYGNWARYWGACGCPFKEFLCDLNISYTSGKFRCDTFFDLDATVEIWKKEVIDCRRSEGIDAEEARELFDEIIEIEEERPDLEGVKYMMWNTDKLLSFFESMPHIEMTIHPMFERFWDELWTPFTQELKKEIETELQTV